MTSPNTDADATSREREPVSVTRFDAHTALRPIGRRAENVLRFAGALDKSWWIVLGPNGGYIAALMVHAAELAVDDAERAMRTLTVHYLTRPDEGPIEIEVTIERTGRSMTSLALRMLQGGRAVAVGLAAASTRFDATGPAAEFEHHTRPDRDALARGGGAPVTPFRHMTPPMHTHYEYDRRIGADIFAGADRAETGGFVRLTERRATDARLVAAFADCWPPAIFNHLRPDTAPTRGIPTVELTVHFRATLPVETMAPRDPALVLFRTQTSAEGFIEETGEIWTPDARTLLAESRQLAVLA